MNYQSILIIAISLITLLSFQSQIDNQEELTWKHPHYTDANGRKQGLYIQEGWNIGDCTNIFHRNYCWIKNDTTQFFVEEMIDQNACYEVLRTHILTFNRKLNDTLLFKLHLFRDESLKSFLLGKKDSVILETPNSTSENIETVNYALPSYSETKPDSLLFSFMNENKKYGNSLSPFYFQGKVIPGDYFILDNKNWKIIDTIKYN